MATTQAGGTRRRGAAATRTAILESARLLFTREGYEGVGVRAIAARAGADPALVIRYFGSKERLFAEAVTGAFALGDLVDGERSSFGERLARYMARKSETAGAFDPLLALLRSGPSEGGASLRHVVDEQFVRPLAAWIGGEEATLRAGLIAAYLLGLALTRDVVGSDALATDDPEALVALVAPVLQAYVDGPLPPRQDATSPTL